MQALPALNENDLLDNTAVADYVGLVLTYEESLLREYENNLEAICEQLGIERDEVQASQ